MTLHVVALGARTPVGLCAESAAAAVYAGITRLSQQAYLVGNASRLLIGARDPRLDVRAPLGERLVTMVLGALAEVVRKLLLHQSRLPPVQILLALPETRSGFSEQNAVELERMLVSRTRAWELELDWQVAGRGHAGACVGLRHAMAQSARQAELFIVGGVDSYFDPETLQALYTERRLATPDTRTGFAPGEGAGFVALASESTRRSLQLPSLGVLRGAHTERESKLSSNAEVSRAEGLTQAVLGACSALTLPAQAPGMVLCDLNGERHRAEEWATLQLRIGAQLRTFAYDAPISYWGDLGAASIPLLTVLACRSWQRGYAHDTRALIWAGSESGLRGAALFEQAPP
jgi:3-oxoacyl-[acyl-carrier-protein] synthase I